MQPACVLSQLRDMYQTNTSRDTVWRGLDIIFLFQCAPPWRQWRIVQPALTTHKTRSQNARRVLLATPSRMTTHSASVSSRVSVRKPEITSPSGYIPGHANATLVFLDRFLGILHATFSRSLWDPKANNLHQVSRHSVSGVWEASPNIDRKLCQTLRISDASCCWET